MLTTFSEREEKDETKEKKIARKINILEACSHLHYHMLYKKLPERNYDRPSGTGVLLTMYASTTSLEVLNPSSPTYPTPTKSQHKGHRIVRRKKKQSKSYHILRLPAPAHWAPRQYRQRLHPPRLHTASVFALRSQRRDVVAPGAVHADCAGSHAGEDGHALGAAKGPGGGEVG